MSSVARGPSAGRCSGVEEWRDLTVALSERYVRLEIVDLITDICYPVVSLGLSDTVLVVAMPQRIMPWRPPALVRLADDETGAASADGASAAMSVSLAADTALLLEAASEYTLRWSGDHRWPAGGDLRTVDYGPSIISRDGVNLAEATSGPPPPLTLAHGPGFSS